MTYPDSGAPVDPRDELEAIRRRLAELGPAGRRHGDNGLLMAGGLALLGALAVLLLAIAVAGTLDSGGGQAAVLIAGFCIVAGFAVLGLSLLRRWQGRAGGVRRERIELVARHDVLSAEVGGGSAYELRPSPADRLPIVLGVTLGVLVLFAVVVIILVAVS